MLTVLKYKESRKMHIPINNEEVVQNFVICEFYGTETCFCWNVSKLFIFPFRNDCSEHNLQILSTPSPIKQIHSFDGRIFLICVPHGIYKLSRTNGFCTLSKNAVGIGTEFWQVLVPKKDGIYLDNKQSKSSKLLFKYSVTLNNTRNISTFPLILTNSEERFIKGLTNLEEPENNLCIIGYDKKLFVLIKDTIQLIYTSNNIILDIIPIKRDNKIAGLLFAMYTNVVLIMHCKDNKLVFEQIYLTANIENISALCAGFNPEMEDILWILYCAESELYYVKKKPSMDAQILRVKENATYIFLCIQHYHSNVILGMSKNKELLEIPLEELENSLLNINVNLCTNMFQRTDIIMDTICRKTKELDTLNKILEDEYNTSRKINMYAYKEKLQITPHIEVFKLRNYHYLTLNICNILPKNSHIMFSFNSKGQNIFCLKKTDAEPTFNVKMSIDENKITYFSKVNMDLITLVNEEAPWCLIRNFVNCPMQDHKRKNRSRQDKTVFINAKITSLQCLIAEKDFNMAKLSEMKEVIRRGTI